LIEEYYEVGFNRGEGFGGCLVSMRL
jgi:hypothetical protein